MNIISEIVVEWLISGGVIRKEEKELYQYAVYSLILLILPLIVAAGIGAVLGSVSQGIMVALPFLFLRKYSGGYHAKKIQYCFIASGIALFLSILLSMHLKIDCGMIIVTSISKGGLIIFSPIDHENKRLTECEKKLYKEKVIIQIMVFSIIECILFYFGQYKCVVCLAVGIQLSAVLQIPCIITTYLNDQKSKKNVV